MTTDARPLSEQSSDRSNSSERKGRRRSSRSANSSHRENINDTFNDDPSMCSLSLFPPPPSLSLSLSPLSLTSLFLSLPPLLPASIFIFTLEPLHSLMGHCSLSPSHLHTNSKEAHVNKRTTGIRGLQAQSEFTEDTHLPTFLDLDSSPPPRLTTAVSV